MLAALALLPLGTGCLDWSKTDGPFACQDHEDCPESLRCGYDTELKAAVCVAEPFAEPCPPLPAPGCYGRPSCEWSCVPAGSARLPEPCRPSPDSECSDGAGGAEVAVELEAFGIRRYEVTRGEFVSWLRELGADEDTVFGWFDGGDEGPLRYDPTAGGWRVTGDKALRPMTTVTHLGARTYCAGIGARLCTDAEWLVAAGAGCRDDITAACGAEARFPWGTGAPTCERAQFAACGAGLAPVGIEERAAGVSPYGVYDLVGNASEWTSGCADGNEPCLRRAVRGGGAEASELQLDLRRADSGSPTETAMSRGIRCCR